MSQIEIEPTRYYDYHLSAKIFFNTSVHLSANWRSFLVKIAPWQGVRFALRLNIKIFYMELNEEYFEVASIRMTHEIKNGEPQTPGGQY